MTWATPALAAIVAACVIPPLILLYFLKLKRREQVIPSTLLWKQSVQDMQANAPFQRLRMSLLLFLQLLALILLFLALSQPEWHGKFADSTRTVLLLDRSASMSATDVEPSRFEQAKTLALQYVDNLESGGVFRPLAQPEKVMVIGFADEAQVYCPFTSSKAQLSAAINSITPTHGRSTLKQALELTRAQSVSIDPANPGREVGRPASILLISDGRIADIADQVAREPLRYQRVGNPDSARNIGIVAVDARRSYVNQDEVVIYVRLANYGPEPVTTGLFLSAGDQLLKSASAAIPAAQPSAIVGPDASTPTSTAPATDESANSETTADTSASSSESASASATDVVPIRPGATESIFRLVQQRGITLGVEIDHKDHLDVDNRAFVVVPPARHLRVGFVGDNFVLDAVLEGLTLSFVKQVEPISPARFDQLVETGETDLYDVIVLDRQQPARLGPGRYLTFGMVPPLPGFSEGPADVENQVLDADPRHPVNRYVGYSRLVMAPRKPLVAPPTARRLVEGSAGPVIVEVSDRNLHALVVSFDVLASNWPWDPDLPIFMQNAVDYLGHVGEALVQEATAPGQALIARLPVEATDINLIRPDGATVALTPIDPSMTSYGPIETAGLYAVTYRMPREDAALRRDYAVNLLDEFECDIRPAPVIRLKGAQGMDVVAAAGSESQKRALWTWAVLAALLFILLEWWVYVRRSYI